MATTAEESIETNGEVFTCKYEVRINDVGGRVVETKKVRASTAEGAAETIRRQLEAKGKRVLAIAADGASGSFEWYIGDPLDRWL